MAGETGSIDNTADVGWVLIPPTILSRADLCMGEKVLWGRINGLSTKTGECFASNQWLGEQLGYSERTIEGYIATLVEKECVARTYGPNGKRDRRLIPIPQGAGKGILIPTGAGSHPAKSRVPSRPEPGCPSVSSRLSIRDESSSSAAPRVKVDKESLSRLTEGFAERQGYRPRGDAWLPIQQGFRAMLTKEAYTVEQIEGCMDVLVGWGVTWTIATVRKWVAPYAAGKMPTSVDRKSTNGDRLSPNDDEAYAEQAAQYHRCLSAARQCAAGICVERSRDVLTEEDRQKIADLQAAQQRHEERAADIKARLEARGVIVDEKERVR